MLIILIVYKLTVVNEHIKVKNQLIFQCCTNVSVQIHQRCQHGSEVDCWPVGCVMYDMMLGKCHLEDFVHPEQYPSYLTQDSVSIMRMVSIN